MKTRVFALLCLSLICGCPDREIHQGGPSNFAFPHEVMVRLMKEKPAPDDAKDVLNVIEAYTADPGVVEIRKKFGTWDTFDLNDEQTKANNAWRKIFDDLVPSKEAFFGKVGRVTALALAAKFVAADRDPASDEVADEMIEKFADIRQQVSSEIPKARNHILAQNGNFNFEQDFETSELSSLEYARYPGALAFRVLSKDAFEAWKSLSMEQRNTWLSVDEKLDVFPKYSTFAFHMDGAVLVYTAIYTQAR